MLDTAQHPGFLARLKRLVPDFLLGATAALGLAPVGLWAATVVALAILIRRLTRGARSDVFLRTLAAGAGWFGLSLSWIVEPFLVQPEIHGWMAPFALILMALGGGLFWALPVWLAARLTQGGRGMAIAIVAALLLSDWLRGWIFTGFPWALIGHVWIDTPVSQAAAWTGALGLSALTLLLALLPVLAGQGPRRIAAGAALSLLIGGAIWAGGALRLAAPVAADRDIMLRVVQPNAEQRLKWDPEWAEVFLYRLLDLSGAPGRRDLVIWPETAVNFLLDDAGDWLPVMSRTAAAPLLIGIQRREGTRYFNSLATIGEGGAIGGLYDKFHLVPFGEYIPFGDQLARLGIGAFAAQAGNGYSEGPGPVIMELPGLPDFQPLICYEAIFSQHLRGLPQRPGWLLQVTNDSWFGQISGPYQHLAQARLRSIESGLPLVRAANTGISAIIDARGQVREMLPLGAAGKIDALLPAALPQTVWMRIGDWPILVLTLLALGAAIRDARRRR